MRRLLFLFALVSCSAFAGSVALTAFSGGGTGNFVNTFGNVTVGWSFTVNTALTVDGLGLFDCHLYTCSGSLTQDHAVGIWDSTGQLLVSGTVSPGDTLSAGFRWVTVSNTLLSPGTYTIGALYTPTVRLNTDAPDDFYSLGNTSVSTNAAITFLGAAYTEAATLSKPGNLNTSSRGRFGPNFDFTVNEASSVPEPGTLSAALLGGVALALLRRRRQAAAQLRQ
jgi:hypothetical protein